MKLESGQRVNPGEETTDGALARGVQYLLGCQEEAGYWDGRYDGPQFLVPAYVICMSFAGIEIEEEIRDGMLRYLGSQVRGDGGWGLHTEDEESRVFTTVLCYVASRLLGLRSDDKLAREARQWMEKYGDARASAPWGKFLLSLLQLYDYRGVFPLPPELWLLPRFLPFHPSRLWCHSRMVYLPMSYLYGRRAQVERTPELDAIRSEVFAIPVEEINWEETMLEVAERDTFRPISPWMRGAARALSFVERAIPKRLRKRALSFVAEQVRREDENTNFICLGPINKVLNLLVRICEEGSDQEAVRRHLEMVSSYFWEDELGIRLNGYKNSRVWDTAFALQALDRTKIRSEEVEESVRRGCDFIGRQQILEEIPDRESCFRGPVRGGFPFCDSPHGWPVTDSTAEALVAMILGKERFAMELDSERIEWAVARLLAWQNPDGGWGTFEPRRGPYWLEAFDPSRVFADTMIEYSYNECTSACFRALLKARPHLEPSVKDQIDSAVARGRDFLLQRQKRDGSWTGAWAICFTYGTWFGVWGLRAAGVGEDDPSMQKARKYLESIQLPDGGWGEMPESCRFDKMIPTECGQVVMTAWALLALARCGGQESEAATRGLNFLRTHQNADGSWPEQHISGVFNRTCAIHYDNYKKVFPLWALAEYEA